MADSPEHRIKVTITVEAWLDDDEYVAEGLGDPRAALRARRFEEEAGRRIRAMIGSQGLSDNDFIEDVNVETVSDMPDEPLRLMTWTAIHTDEGRERTEAKALVLDSDIPLTRGEAMAVAHLRLPGRAEIHDILMGDRENDLEDWIALNADDPGPGI